MREKESAIFSAFSFLLLLLFAFVKVAFATILHIVDITPCKVTLLIGLFICDATKSKQVQVQQKSSEKSIRIHIHFKIIQNPRAR